MRLFLSWSGDLSHRVAKAFAEWIPDVINAIEPWLSSAHIEAGSAWNSELQNQLRCCEFGVFFVTARNDQSPWLQFEFGALASRLENTSVCPYLVDIRSAQLPAGPLTQFQTTQSDKTGTWSLITALNRKLGDSALREDRLQRMFDRLWPDLCKAIADAIEQDGDEDPPARSESSMIEETLLLTRRLNHRLDLKTWSLRHTGPEGALLIDASHVQPDEPISVGADDNPDTSHSSDSLHGKADVTASAPADDVATLEEIPAVNTGSSTKQADSESAEERDSSDDDHFQQALPLSFDAMRAQFNADDDSFSETVQSDPDALAGDEDGYAQTVRSDADPAGFMQTLADRDLMAGDQQTMADAWGSDSLDATAGARKQKAKTGIDSLVISERPLSTRRTREYNKGRRPPEPDKPEYELLKKLGEGGMGVVYTARQTSINREVALKMLKAKTAKDKEQQCKFLSEAVVTGDLSHPNIVPIYDVGRGPDQTLFYAMKKVEGLPWQDVLKEEFECLAFETLDELGVSQRDLRKVRKGDKQLEDCEWYEHGRSWALPYLFPDCSPSQLKRMVDANQNIRQVMEEMNIEAPTEPHIYLVRLEMRSAYREKQLDILSRCADAIAFAHSRGVIHRDLKPENIMLGAFNEVLVVDWGLAYSTKDFRKSSSVTETTSMGGTPAYMAPEMATGPISRIGPASDIYLLGAILFEVISGRPPHAGKNAMKCLMSAAKNLIREVDQEEVERNDPSGELMEIALKSMATNPEDRYQSVDEMQAALREHDSHAEIVTLTAAAFEHLEDAKVSQTYDQFLRARFGFEQVIEMWGVNLYAENGLLETQLEFAKCAKKRGDFDLGLSLLDVSVPEHKLVYDELQSAQDTFRDGEHKPSSKWWRR